MLEAAIHEEAAAALNRLQKQHGDLKGKLEKSYGYAVFPSVGRAGVVLGGAYGQGEVYESGQPVGFATISQITVGVQVGGQTFSEILIFHNKKSMDNFKKRGKLGFTANASAVIIKAAATATNKVSDVEARAYSLGGMLLEASLGGSKVMFIPPMGNQPKIEEKAEQQQPEGKEQQQPEGKEQQPEAKDQQENSQQKQQTEANQSQPEEDDPPAQGVATWAKDQLGKIPGVDKLIPHDGKGKHPIMDKIKNAISGVKTELATNKTLKKDAEAALIWAQEKYPNFKKAVDKAYGFAIFPAVGKARLVLGGAFGKGVVFEQGKLVGYAALIQITIGVQIGGETLSAIVLFSDKAALDRFRNGKVNFNANAAAVIVKAGAEATTRYEQDNVYYFSEGGLLIEVGIGGQKFVYRQAALTKGQEIHQEKQEKS
jgi:lipid-binding SYLF domain-containing protein